MESLATTGSRFDRFMRSLLRADTLRPNKESLDPRPLLRAYARAAGRYPIAVLLTLVATVIERLAYVFIPIVLKEFIDLLSGAKGAESAAMEKLAIYGALLATSWLGARIAVFAMCYKTPLVIADLKKEGLAHMIRHNHRFFASMFLGALVKRIDRYAGHYDGFADRIVFDIIPTAIQFTGVAIVLWYADPLLFALVVTWIVLVIGANYAYSSWILPYNSGRATQDSRTTGVLADIISNSPAIGAHASHVHEEERFAREAGKQALWTRFSWMSTAAFDAFLGLSVRVIELAILGAGAYLFFHKGMTVGTVVMAHAYVRVIGDQTWAFSRIFRELYTCFADGKEMTDILAMPHEVEEPVSPKVPERDEGEVEFRGVGFGYQGEATLHGLDLRIAPGERVALVGPSGSGKSTIARLLLRDYDPTSGSVRIDGVDLRDLASPDRAKRMALVPQEPTLFHLSLMENIRYGRLDATDEEVVEAAKLAQADGFIRATKRGYDTLVGERGVKLSGGQRQRVAIARALLRRAPILILDEATSSLDSESEMLIQRALGALMEGRTTLVIAHRLSTIRSADRIVVLDQGTIAEEGTHEELIRKDGLYARHWSLQKDGFIADTAVDIPEEAPSEE